MISGGSVIRFTLGFPVADKENDARLLAEGWTKLKEPGSVASAILLSVPLIIVNLAISGLVSILAAPAVLSQLSVPAESISITIGLMDLIFIFVLLTLVLFGHEFLHLAFIPGFHRSAKTFAGITYAGPFVGTGEVLSKRRYLLISLAPYFILSILLPAIAGLAGMMSALVMIIALLNALGASVDILGMLLVWTQAPSGARIICNGMNTYWKQGNVKDA